MRPRLATAAILSAVVLAGCSGRPENSPAIRKKFAEMDEMKATLTETSRDTKSTLAELKVMQDQLSDIRALTPDADGTIDVVARLDKMENRLASMEGGTTSVKNSTKGGADKTGGTSPAVEKNAKGGSTDSIPEELFVDAADDSGKTTAVATKAKSDTPKASKKTKSGKKSKKTTVTQVSEKKPTAPTGKYYTIKSGDTLDKIASNSGITLDSLKKANRLPSTAKVLAGQRLFVPIK